MKIIQVKNQTEGAQAAFEILQEKLAAGIHTLGLATGSSPLAFYERLTASDVDFSQLTSVNLDEYVGLDAKHPQSYHYFMQQHLFDAKPLKESFLPNGAAIDLQAEIQRYQQILQLHPVDVQILGLGRNGHIGFNEPGSSFDSRVHLADLAPSTIEANARFFESPEAVPKQALSMGIADIISAKTILLFAYGSEKAAALAAMIKGAVTEDLPASILQTHPEVYVISDAAALDLLKK